jgi:hypothetical protein
MSVKLLRLRKVVPCIDGAMANTRWMMFLTSRNPVTLRVWKASSEWPKRSTLTALVRDWTSLMKETISFADS